LRRLSVGVQERGEREFPRIDRPAARVQAARDHS
jgi:hypothetical protein